MAAVPLVCLGAHAGPGRNRLVRLRGSRQLYEDQFNGDLEARARLCGKPIEQLLTRGKTAEVDALCKELGRSSKTRITVVLPSGQVVGDSEANPADMDNHGRRAEVLEAAAGRVGCGQRTARRSRKTLIYVAVPLGRGGVPPADPPPADPRRRVACRPLTQCRWLSRAARRRAARRAGADRGGAHLCSA